MTVTVTIPSDLEVYLQEKASEQQTSPANYLVALVEMDRSASASAMEMTEAMSVGDRAALNAILEQRDEGPFVALTEGWKERVMAKALANLGS